MIELKTYAGSNVTPQNDAIMNDTNTLNNGIYYGCNVTIKDATTLHINAGQGIVYGRLFEVLDSDIPVSLSQSGTLLGQLYVHIDLSNIAAPIQILVDTGETLADLEDDPQLNIDSGITDMQLATFTVSTVGMSDLVETFAEVEPIRAVLGDADISAIGDGSVKGAIRTISTQLTPATASVTPSGYIDVVSANHLVAIGLIAELTLDIARNTYPLPKNTVLASIPARCRPTFDLLRVPCTVRNASSGEVRSAWANITSNGNISIFHNSTDSENMNELELHIVYFVGN